MFNLPFVYFGSVFINFNSNCFITFAFVIGSIIIGYFEVVYFKYFNSIICFNYFIIFDLINYSIFNFINVKVIFISFSTNSSYSIIYFNYFINHFSNIFIIT